MYKGTLKYILTAGFILIFGSKTYAVAPGLYFGLMAGPATNSGKLEFVQVLNKRITTPASPRSKQFGSRLFIGYKMNPYAGLEGGITYFSGIHYDTRGVQTCSGPTVRVRDFDFVGKGSLPLGWFDVFGKAGVAITYTSVSGTFNPSFSNSCGKSTYRNKFTPTVSIGASYDITQSWVVDASFNRLLVGNQPGNVDLYAIGFSYHFVDVYCGQFLCD